MQGQIFDVLGGGVRFLPMTLEELDGEDGDFGLLQVLCKTKPRSIDSLAAVT